MCTLTSPNCFHELLKDQKRRVSSDTTPICTLRHVSMTRISQEWDSKGEDGGPGQRLVNGFEENQIIDKSHRFTGFLQ